jgi:hypothetical protein
VAVHQENQSRYEESQRLYQKQLLENSQHYEESQRLYQEHMRRFRWEPPVMILLMMAIALGLILPLFWPKG